LLTLSSNTQNLADKTSAVFCIRDPKYYLVPNVNVVSALRFILDDADDLLRRGDVAEGVALLCWAPYLLASAVGHDFRTVSSIGQKVAAFLAQPSTERRNALVQFGLTFALDSPEQYFNGASDEDVALVLWNSVIAHLQTGRAHSALRLAFWAVCVRTAEYDLSASRADRAVAAAADVFRESEARG